jgi:hypothetical protein
MTRMASWGSMKHRDMCGKVRAGSDGKIARVASDRTLRGIVPNIPQAPRTSPPDHVFRRV